MAMCFAVNCVAVEKLCVGNCPDFENMSRALFLEYKYMNVSGSWSGKKVHCSSRQKKSLL